jgi:hypothetical protein
MKKFPRPWFVPACSQAVTLELATDKKNRLLLTTGFFDK